MSKWLLISVRLTAIFNFSSVPQLVEDLAGSLKRLLISSSCDFWCTGRILVQVEQQSVLIIDGELRWLFAKMIFLKNVSLYGMC